MGESGGEFRLPALLHDNAKEKREECRIEQF